MSETADVSGIPLRFVDTAGIHETRDEAEAIGVQKSFQATADSDLRLLVVDASERWTGEDSKLLRKIRPLGGLLIACNKCDLPLAIGHETIEHVLSCDGDGAGISGCPAGQIDRTQPQVEVVWTSALKGDGLEELKAKILEMAAPASGAGPEGE